MKIVKEKKREEKEKKKSVCMWFKWYLVCSRARFLFYGGSVGKHRDVKADRQRMKDCVHERKNVAV